MKFNYAFTLLELLISLSLSSFIMLGLIQGYRNTVNFLENTQAMIQTNRHVFLLFNQIEKDFSTAFIPTIHKKINPLKDSKKLGEKQASKEEQDAEKADQKALTPEEEKKAKAAEKEKKKKLFLGLMDDGDLVKDEGKKLAPFKSVTFISTNPLQIFGQKKARFVRLMYELVVDKTKKQQDKVCYKLLRKETPEIEDEKMKVSEFDYEKAKTSPMRTHVVAKDIKGMYIEYVTYKEEKEKNEASKPQQTKTQKKDELRSPTWGEKDYSKGVVPQRIEVRVDFWNDAMTTHHSFKMMVPLWSYPTPQEKKKKKVLQVVKAVEQKNPSPAPSPVVQSNPNQQNPEPQGSAEEGSAE
jgi:hypothetical protein